MAVIQVPMIEQTLSREQQMKLHLKRAIVVTQTFLMYMKRAVEQLEKLDPNDRLEYTAALEYMVVVLSTSLETWKRWITIRNMRKFKLEDFKKIFAPLREAVLMWVKIDLEVSEDILAKLEKEDAKLDITLIPTVPIDEKELPYTV